MWGPTTGAGFGTVKDEDPAWGGTPIRFPRIQGADVCGGIVAVGQGVNPAWIGERIITDNWLRDPDDPSNKEKCGYFGSERDGGFAQFTTLPAVNAQAVTSGLSDAELATFSCSYSTAGSMLMRASVTSADTVLVPGARCLVPCPVPGASGGVGGALVQLAKRCGARVIGQGSEPSTQMWPPLPPPIRWTSCTQRKRPFSPRPTQETSWSPHKDRTPAGLGRRPAQHATQHATRLTLSRPFTVSPRK